MTVLLERHLHRLEDRRVDNRFVLAVVARTLMSNPADIDRVCQERVDLFVMKVLDGMRSRFRRLCVVFADSAYGRNSRSLRVVELRNA
jgi:hypothetical protein